jgi:adenine/guanine/hypoxanthine permease
MLRYIGETIASGVESAFETKERKTTIPIEFLCGCLHFFGNLYTLPVIPSQLHPADYAVSNTAQITAVSTAVGCIIASYITNLPFIIAPPASVSIYLAVALQRNQMSQSEGDSAVILSGIALIFIGVFKPLTSFATKLIPDCIQAATAVGIGLITALAGAIELELVVPGEYSILQMGKITPAILVATAGTTLISVALYYKVKGAYTIGLIFGTLMWWCFTSDWPTTVFSTPAFHIHAELGANVKIVYLLLNLLFLYVITLSGIARAMSDLAHLTASDGSIPRGNWLFIMCGVATIFSGYFSGPPILVSPESAPGIKAGARTGLSMMVCGLLYCIATFFTPVFANVPPCGTSPLLIMVGLTLFVNVGRIRWSNPDEAVPAFFVLFMIPFTYSILTGVGVGYLFYVLIGVFSGQLYRKSQRAFCRSRPKSMKLTPTLRTNGGGSSSSRKNIRQSNPMIINWGSHSTTPTAEEEEEEEGEKEKENDIEESEYHADAEKQDEDNDEEEGKGGMEPALVEEEANNFQQNDTDEVNQPAMRGTRKVHEQHTYSALSDIQNEIAYSSIAIVPRAADTTAAGQRTPSMSFRETNHLPQQQQQHQQQNPSPSQPQPQSHQQHKHLQESEAAYGAFSSYLPASWKRSRAHSTAPQQRSAPPSPPPPPSVPTTPRSRARSLADRLPMDLANSINSFHL